MRTFLAIDVNSKEAIKRIVDLQKKLLESGADLKLVEPQNLHFTIKFFGELNETDVNELVKRVKNLHTKPIDVTYKGIGVFPHLRHISVIWVGVDSEGEKKLREVAERVNELLIGFKYKDRDDKPFQPHITISRVKSNRNKDRLLNVITDYRDYIFGNDTLNSIKLKKSELTPKGPIYTDLYTFPFVEG
ncbi:MAG: RNA 2',3'-cyclic phosphodiesterase [Nitrososphaerota archaeon]|nr:RNA 2',3'-cyclic phosphodiesterase [Nitrososphaerales archaeon]MDW8044832.1 RNA 2',3'-cyclic phosphodiesterase [Nitrososphaerota archaeon]